MFKIKKKQNLKTFTTMAVDVEAYNYLEIHSVEELIKFLKEDYVKPLYILGGGSNTVFLKDFEGTILHIHNLGKEIVKEDENAIYVRANAGENWHKFVLWTLSRNFGGLENLSLIPGRVGASPMQNIGAYGVEIKDVFHQLEAVDIETKNVKVFKYDECEFGYRESVFKNKLKGKYIITSVTFKLTKNNHTIRTEYGAIKQQLLAMQVEQPTIQDVSKAVIAIRESKLPNPSDIPNCGSFFKNPIVENVQYNLLKNRFPDIPGYSVSKKHTKIPAGWLIDKAGWKGYRNEKVGVHDKQALVLINCYKGNGKDIYDLSEEIIADIHHKFGIKLDREVNII